MFASGLFGVFVSLSLVVSTGCEVTKIESPLNDVGPTDGTTDDSAEETASGPLTCAPGPGGNIDADCPDGQFCHVQAGQCVECLIHQTQCDTDGVRQTCEKPVLDANGTLVSGGLFVADPCGASSACVPDSQGVFATCEPLVCEPLSSTCDPEDITNSRVCGAYGTRYYNNSCGSGKACREGECRAIRSDVLLIFDTSSSMLNELPGRDCKDNPTVPCLDHYPACDQTAEPLTPMDLAKEVFTKGIVNAIDQHASFALQRFPQRVAAAKDGNCNLGWYQNLVTMSGDDGSHATVDGGWFDKNRSEVIASPFPTGSDTSNLPNLLAWLDRDEVLSPTALTCISNADCASNRCAQTPDGPRCFRHTNPELRAGGGTPLGKSLFYAGEYLRRQVLVDGKACETSDDCRSANYVCRDSACVDERRHCRQPTIVLFTDGGESGVNDPFFAASVQAKRLKYGLGCASDAECSTDAHCGQAGYCLPKDAVGGAVSSYISGDGHEAVRAPDGSPLAITVHVVNLNAGGGSAAAASIARNGGGFVYDVDTAVPGEFEAKVKTVLLVDPKCKALDEL